METSGPTGSNSSTDCTLFWPCSLYGFYLVYGQRPVRPSCALALPLVLPDPCPPNREINGKSIQKLHYVMNFQTWEQISLRTDQKKNMFNQMETENWNWLQFGQILLEISYKTRMSFIPCSLSKVYCVGFLSTSCAGASSFTLKKCIPFTQTNNQGEFILPQQVQYNWLSWDTPKPSPKQEKIYFATINTIHSDNIAAIKPELSKFVLCFRHCLEA